MKQNIILIVILIGLFVFGLLIYDFSDALDNVLYDSSWYIYEDGKLNKMDFKDNEFSYVNVDSGKVLDNYKSCHTFRYNRSINVIKLNCNINENKIYVSSFDKNSLVMQINGTEKTYYSSKNEANKFEFIKNNGLTKEEYDKLVDIDFTKYSSIIPAEFDTLLNSKETNYVAVVNSNVNYANISNYVALDKFISEAKKNVLLLNVSNITKEDAKNLHSKSDYFSADVSEYITNEINIYMIGNKKIKFVTKLDFKDLKSAKEFKVEE